MNNRFKLTLVAATILITACGGSGSKQGDNKITPPNNNSSVIIEEGIQHIRKEYTPLRLNLVNLRDEQARLLIGLPATDGGEGEYATFMSTTLNKAHPYMLQTQWKNGNDHSIQIHNSKLNTELDVVIESFNSNNPWKFEDKISADGVSGHAIILPRETDIEDELPIAFIDGKLDFDAIKSEGHISFVNRFSHSTLSKEQSTICLAVIDENGDVLAVDDNLEQTEATDLIDGTTLGQASMKRLVVVTNATLKSQAVFRPITPEQLQAIANVCSNHTVGNGENLWEVDVAARISSMTTDIIYSPAEGEIRTYKTTAQLPSLKWETETEYLSH